MIVPYHTYLAQLPPTRLMTRVRDHTYPLHLLYMRITIIYQLVLHPYPLQYPNNNICSSCNAIKVYPIKGHSQ